MRKNISSLSQNELMIMEVIWNSSEPLTSVDIAEFVKEWKSAYLNNLLSSLQKKGMIEMVGVIQCGKHYVRQFVPVYTKEQYVAGILDKLNVGRNSLPKIAVALVEKSEDDKNERIIAELESIIMDLKERDSKKI